MIDLVCCIGEQETQTLVDEAEWVGSHCSQRRHTNCPPDRQAVVQLKKNTKCCLYEFTRCKIKMQRAKSASSRPGYNSSAMKDRAEGYHQHEFSCGRMTALTSYFISPYKLLNLHQIFISETNSLTKQVLSRYLKTES